MKAERTTIISLISQAQASGARQSLACEIVGISPKTLQRWRKPGTVQDGRLDAIHEPGEQADSIGAPTHTQRCQCA